MPLKNILKILSLFTLLMSLALPFAPAEADDGLFEKIQNTISSSEDAQAISAEDLQNIHPASGDMKHYELSVSDTLRITVFGVEDLTGKYGVDHNGNITMPLVGQLEAEGKKTTELEKEITNKLIEGGYYNSPNVTVEIIGLAPFYILGEVKGPGRYEYVPGLDIFKAIAIAGGYTPRAAKSKIYIIRDIDGEKTEIKATEETIVLPGDSIKVKQRFF